MSLCFSLYFNLQYISYSLSSSLSLSISPFCEEGRKVDILSQWTQNGKERRQGAEGDREIEKREGKKRMNVVNMMNDGDERERSGVERGEREVRREKISASFYWSKNRSPPLLNISAPFLSLSYLQERSCSCYSLKFTRILWQSFSFSLSLSF